MKTKSAALTLSIVVTVGTVFLGGHALLARSDVEKEHGNPRGPTTEEQSAESVSSSSEQNNVDVQQGRGAAEKSKEAVSPSEQGDAGAKQEKNKEGSGAESPKRSQVDRKESREQTKKRQTSSASQENTGRTHKATPPKILTITPRRGAMGTVVILTGRNFTPTENAILIYGKLSVSNLLSDGTTLEFSLPAGFGCGTDRACPLKVVNANGRSNAKPFRIVGGEVSSSSVVSSSSSSSEASSPMSSAPNSSVTSTSSSEVSSVSSSVASTTSSSIAGSFSSVSSVSSIAASSSSSVVSASSSSSSQIYTGDVTIRGRFIERFTQKPIPNVPITIGRTDTGTPIQVKSDVDGNFSFTTTTSDVTPTSPKPFPYYLSCNMVLGHVGAFFRGSDGKLSFNSFLFDLSRTEFSLSNVQTADIDRGDFPQWPAVTFSLTSDIPVKVWIAYPEEGRGVGNVLLKTSHTLSNVIPLEYDARVQLTDGAGTVYTSPVLRLPLSNGCAPVTLRFAQGQFTWVVAGQ